MNRMTVKLAAGAGLLLTGAFLLVGTPLYKNALIQRLAGVLDFSDRVCLRASVGKGSSCPEGCLPRPIRTPEERYAAPECRSRLWIGTCGKACAPAEGLVRLDGNHLASADALKVELKEDADVSAFMRGIEAMKAEANSSLSGLYRYRIVIRNPKSDLRTLDRAKSALEKTDGVARVEYELK